MDVSMVFKNIFPNLFHRRKNFKHSLERHLIIYIFGVGHLLLVIELYKIEKLNLYSKNSDIGNHFSAFCHF